MASQPASRVLGAEHVSNPDLDAFKRFSPPSIDLFSLFAGGVALDVPFHVMRLGNGESDPNYYYNQKWRNIWIRDMFCY